MLQSRLQRRLRELQMDSIEAYETTCLNLRMPRPSWRISSTSSRRTRRISFASLRISII